MPDIKDIFLFFNVAMIGIVVLIALVGFVRGTRKSIFYLIPTLVIFGGGWLLMGLATNFLMDFDLSSFNLSIGEVAIPSIREGVINFITDSAPEAVVLMEEDTLAREMVIGITNMVVKVLYLIVLVVLAFTVFKVLTDIFWMIFKPKKKRGTKKKKSIGSRFGGMGIGAAKGLFYVLLITFPLAGIASIFNSLASVTQDPAQEMGYQLVFVNNEVSLVETNTKLETSSDLDFLFDFFEMYQESVPSKVFGTVNVDTFLFDGIFSFKVNNTSMQLRKELEIVATALNRSSLLQDGDFNINKLLEEDPETLKLIVDDLSKLQLVKVAIPMGIEAIMYLKDENGEPVVTLPEGFDVDLEELKSKDFSGDVKKLGYAFVDFTTIYSLDGSTEVDYMGFDPITVKRIMKNVGSTEVVSNFAPMAISYVLSMKELSESLSKLGLTVDDLKLDEVENWAKEIEQFGVIYEKIYNLQIKAFDETETFEHVTPEKVRALSEAIFESVLISNATPVMVESLTNEFVEEEYRKDLVFDHSIWDADEFSALVNAGVTILKSGLATTEDIESKFKDLEDQTIDDLAKYLSQSKFITTNLNVVIQSIGIGELTGVDVELVTLSTEEWTEVELRSLFHTAKIIFSEGQENLIQLDDDKILTLSTHLSHSKFITRNIEAILDVALENVDMGVDVQIGTFAHWEDQEKAQHEFFYLMKSARIVNDKGSEPNTLLSLTDEELDVFLNSQLISETLVNVLIEYSKEGNSLELLIGVDDPNVSWYDAEFIPTTFSWDGLTMNIVPVAGATKYNILKNEEKIGTTRLPSYTIGEMDPQATYEVVAFTEGELRKMFLAVGSITDTITSDTGFSTDMITSLSDEEIDNIMISDILVLSMIDFLEKESEKTDAFITIPEGDLRSTDPEVKLNAWKDRIEDNRIVYGELSKAFKGMRILLEGVSLDNFAVEDFIGIEDDEIEELLKSLVISESIIVQIEKLAADEESLFNIPAGVGLGTDDTRDEWLNTYAYDVDFNLVLETEGEISRLLRAIRVINPQGELENIDVANILKEDNRETVLQSLIVEETLIYKVREVGEGQADISIPAMYLVPDTSPWKKSSQGQGELRRLLNSLSYIMNEEDSINDIKFDLSAIIEDQDEILKSDIIVETIVVKVQAQDEIHIPQSTYFGLTDELDRSSWKNEYVMDSSNEYVYDEFDKVVVKRRGEISKLLNAADIILEPDPITGERSFEGINFDINIAFDEANQEVLLQSLVISETIVMKIFEESEKENSDIAIPSKGYVNPKASIDLNENNRELWFNTYDNNGDKIGEGEIAHLLKAVEVLMGPDGNFEEFSLDMNIIFDDANQKIVLRSTVISESIVSRVYKESSNQDSMLRVPSTGYVEALEDPRDFNRLNWFNTYDLDGEVLTYGEISFMLNAVEVLIGPDGDFDNLDFKLNVVFDSENQKIVLRSTVISESIVQRVFEEAANSESMLRIPNKGYVEQANDVTEVNRTKWFNTYDANGEILTHGEISFMLSALEVLIGPDGDFENLDFKLNVVFDDENQKIVLRSTVISESIVHRVFEESTSGVSMIRIPNTGYVEALMDSSDTNRTKWFNAYNPTGDVTTYGEISHMLEAVQLLVGEDGSFENLNFNLEEIFEPNKQKKILMSKVISETIVDRIVTEASMPSNDLKLPNDSYLEALNDPTERNREKWFNTYLENGDVVTYGEISHLLAAVERLREPGELIQDLSFKLNALFVDQDQEVILRSKIVSETIVDKIYTQAELGFLHLPSEDYVDAKSPGNRDRWFNHYDDEDVLIQTGEIRALLEAVEHIVGDEGEFESLTFDLKVVFDDTKQDDILRSVVIAETIVHKIFEESSNGVLVIPSSTYVNDLNDPNPFNRSLWFNTYRADGIVDTFGELHYLLEAAEILTNGGDFEGLNFSVGALFVPNDQEKILKSTVFSETILDKILAQDDTVAAENIPSVDWFGRRLDDPLNRDAWFNHYVDETLVTKNELANFLDSIALVVGDSSFEDLGAITIDDILKLEFNVVMNANKIVVSSDFDRLLNSIVMESIVAPLVQDIVTNGGPLEEFLDEPVGGYNFKKADLITDYTWSTYQAELYDTKPILDSIYIMNNNGINYKDLANMDFMSLDNNAISGLGDAMVASRVFRGSIATMYNNIFFDYFISLPDQILVPGMPPNMKTKKNWSEVMFVQSRYDGMNEKDTHEQFTQDLGSWKDINTLYE